MSTSSSFTVVNDDTLCAAVQATRQVLVYVAPGITKPVVDSISRSLECKDSLLVTVIVDLDPEVYRLGYGTQEGLMALQKLVQTHHLELRQQPGLRVGLLVTDQRTLVYSPTPLLIEAGSTAAEKPNAIVIAKDGDTTAALIHACGAAGTHDETTPTPEEAEIGCRVATPQAVRQSLAELKEVPPKKFSVARIERVYESKIQFVELELTGYRLSAKRVNIPNDLLVGEDKTFKERLRNSFALLQGEQAITVCVPEFDLETLMPKVEGNQPITTNWSEATLEDRRKALYEDFLINVPRFGQIIMRRNRTKFDQRLALFKKQIEAFNEAVQDALEQKLAEAVKTLAQTLLPRIRDRVPQRYERVLPIGSPSDDDLLSIIKHDLAASFGTSAEVFKPELRCVFKDVTYETISDEGFRGALAKALRDSGGDRVVGQLFSEHDAAPEV